jgi:hypothetical protein
MPTTITGGDLKFIADQAVSNASEILLATKAFSLGIEPTGMTKGDSTQVFVAGSAPDAAAFNRTSNNYMTDNGGEHSFEKLTLDKHIKLTFKIEQFDFEKMNPTRMAALYKPYVEKVAYKVISDAFALVTAVKFPNSENAGAKENFDKTEAGKAETELAKLIGQGGERNLILNLDYFDALRDSLSGIYANPTNNEVLRNGTIPGISGFANVIRTSALKPVGSEAGEYLVGIATNMSGIALAVAPVKQVPAFDGESEVSVEPITRIPLTFSIDYSKDVRDYVATVEVLYGIAVLDSKGILRLTYNKQGS